MNTWVSLVGEDKILLLKQEYDKEDDSFSITESIVLDRHTGEVL